MLAMGARNVPVLTPEMLQWCQLAQQQANLQQPQRMLANLPAYQGSNPTDDRSDDPGNF
jgi:hypothetical protein